MKNLDEVALIIESEGYLENCYSIKCDRKAVAELLLDYRDEIVVASLRQVYLRDCLEKNANEFQKKLNQLEDNALEAAIRRVLKHYMSTKEYEEWINEIGEQS